jgi:hypothetical protein
MWDLLKGFGLLLAALLTLTLGYASWMLLVPVSQSDVETRIAHVCEGGQMLNEALGASHRPVSCGCVQAGLRETVGIEGMIKGADVIRQITAAQMWSVAQGEKPREIDKSLMADRDVLMFFASLDKLQRDCKISPFAAAH